jgi:hypothetical protein
MSLRDWFRRKQPPAQAPSDPRELFAAEVLALVKSEGLLDDPQIDPSAFAIRGTSARGQQSIFLANLFAETREVPPEQRPARILRFLRGPAEFDQSSEKSWAEVRDHVAAVVRAATYWTGMGLPPGTMAARPFVPFLIEAVVLDSQNAMQFVTAAELAKWGATPDQLFEAAREAVARAAEVGIERYDDGPAPIWHVASGDDYESSRLLVPGWLASFAGKVRGRPVAAIPHRSMLLVTGDGEPRAIERVLASADAEFKASPRRLSPALYTTSDDGRLVPYDPPPDHPQRGAVRLAHVKLAVYEYGLQKEALDARHEKDGVDVFVANYIARELEDGRAVSYCVWNAKIDSSLPRADLVAFLDEREQTFLVRWADVERLAAACWSAEPDLDPPRMRTLCWPSAPVVAALRAASVKLADFRP